MIVRHVAIRRFGALRELSAAVEYEREPRRSVPLWFRWPEEIGDPPAPGDALLAGLLIPAMALHEDLCIEAPVSAELAEAAAELAPMLQRWFPRLRPATLTGERVPLPAPQPDRRGVGCCFSGGVDSFHSLLGHADRISHLVLIHGFEIEPDDQAQWRTAAGNVGEVARRWDKSLLLPSTNLMEVGSRETQRRLMRQGNPYATFGVTCYFGSMLTAVGLLLRAGLSELIVPASWPYEYVRPAGSHPLLEPRWSTPEFAVRLDGCEADRMEKLEGLAARAPETYRHLRVCVDKRTTQLNCGRCIKCVRTLMELRACGLSELASTFPGPLDLDAVKRLRVPPESHFLPMLAERAARRGDVELARTVAVLLGRRRHWPREWDRAGAVLSGLSPLQAAWHVKAWLRQRGWMQAGND